MCCFLLSNPAVLDSWHAWAEVPNSFLGRQSPLRARGRGRDNREGSRLGLRKEQVGAPLEASSLSQRSQPAVCPEGVGVTSIRGWQKEQIPPYCRVRLLEG